MVMNSTISTDKEQDLGVEGLKMERETRFELATPTLARLCSTAELFPHSFCVAYANNIQNKVQAPDFPFSSILVSLFYLRLTYAFFYVKVTVVEMV